ncbi:hypothetical protein CALVIDRAFT_229122 [Calocera viscosa TUFC12733]|uniref:Uncharacterized protein n=1 Tax=Calocera viscosa (strain TUFC12733) TaxID=1330018 RepID=A0A167JVW2_CALVF|nr:hypothetical protein CALVIDRAFT_229122 [Calocera viscosa TUFC12733]
MHLFLWRDDLTPPHRNSFPSPTKGFDILVSTFLSLIVLSQSRSSLFLSIITLYALQLPKPDSPKTENRTYNSSSFLFPVTCHDLSCVVIDCLGGLWLAVQYRLAFSSPRAHVPVLVVMQNRRNRGDTRNALRLTRTGGQCLASVIGMPLMLRVPFRCLG